MNGIFYIKEIPSWGEIRWSVTWDGKGSVQKPDNLKKIWDSAFDAARKGNSVGFSFAIEAVRINSNMAYEADTSYEYLKHLVQDHGGVTGVGFAYREEAEQFVEDMERYIVWNLMKKLHD